MDLVPLYSQTLRSANIEFHGQYFIMKSMPKYFALLEDGHEIVDCVRKLSAGKKYPLLADIRKTGGASYSCYQTLAIGASQYTSAIAVLVDSPFSRLIGKFYIHHHDLRTIPSKLFTNHQESLSWINQYSP